MAVSYFPWAYALLFTHIFFNPEGGCVFQPRVREALGATLGFRGKFRSTPKVLHPCPKNCIATINGRNPVGVDASGGSITQGCSKTREPWAGRRNTFGIQEHKKCGQRAGLTPKATCYRHAVAQNRKELSKVVLRRDTRNCPASGQTSDHSLPDP